MSKFSQSLSAFMNRVPHVDGHSNQRDSTAELQMIHLRVPRSYQMQTSTKSPHIIFKINTKLNLCVLGEKSQN